MIKDFIDFIDKGVVKKQLPNKPRAEFLIQESEKEYLSLKEIIDVIGVNDDNANSLIKLSYDIMMELIRAKMFLKGFNSSGFGAHEAEISYLKEIGFSRNEIEFADQLRYFRNGIIYYGKIFNKDYAAKVIEFIKNLRKKLK